MRRLVGISIRSAAVTTLLLTGAIYVAAEARQAVRRRWNESQLQISTQLGSGSGDRVAKPTPTSLATFSPKEAQPVTSASDELAAERQAAQLPAQIPQEASPQ